MLMRLFGFGKNKEVEVLKQKIQDLEDKLIQRPALDFSEQLGSEGIRIPYYPLSLRTLWDIAHYSDILRNIINALKGEIFREGIAIKEKWVVKCTNCGKEFQHEDKDMLCDHCGGKLAVPNPEQKLFLENWIKSVNENNQTLIEVLKMIEEDLDIFDDCYVVLLKEYFFSEDGRILGAKVKELVRGNPINFKILADRTGRPARDDEGNILLSCIEHRNHVWKNVKYCPICKKELMKALFKATDKDGKDLYYLENEVLHVSKYNPSLTYGFSPIFSVWQKVVTLLNQDKFMKDYYGWQRPPKGMLFINTANQSALQKIWQQFLDIVRKNPHAIYPIAIETNAKNPVTWVDFMHSLQEMQFTEVRNEFRRAIGSVYGVMPLFAGDVSASGGLNNEGLQIVVTNRAIENSQEIYNTKILPWIVENLGITDYCLELISPETRNIMAELQIEAQKISNAVAMASLGFEVKLNEEGEFEYEKKPTITTEEPKQPEIVGPIQRFSGEPFSVRRGDTKKALLEIFKSGLEEFEKEQGMNIVLKQDVLEEIIDDVKDVVFSKRFEGLTKKESDLVRKIIIDGLKNKYSIGMIVDNILKKVSMDYSQAEKIVRTEEHVLRNKIREIGYRELDKDGKFRYKWLNPLDERTSDICRAIVKRTARGVSLNKLKEIIHEEARKYGAEPREFTPHINCRSTFVRIV